MTIKDIEARSGMTRANIRFYEAEGLLTPARSANGYRDYSDHDLEVLKRIKLLRSLRIPLEEIKALHNDTDDLLHTLDRHIAALNAERQDIDRSEQVCREMRTDGVTYQTLDAQKYLDALDRGVEENALSADVIPAVRSPWRRFFARVLDDLLYTALWLAFLLLICNVNPSYGLLNTLMSLLMMLFLEPLLLHLWGTTPGKWVMGLSVTDSDGGRLTSIVDALACAYIAVVVGALTLSLISAEMPRHRGSITTAEFCDNFNRLAAFQNISYESTLDSDGTWRSARDTYSINVDGQATPPDFTITETDGVVTRVEFQYASHKPEYWPPSFQDQMILSAFSYAGVQEGLFGYLNTRDTILSEIQAHPYESFSFTENGVTLTCNVAYSGYDPQGAKYLWPIDDPYASYTFSFCMEKTA